MGIRRRVERDAALNAWLEGRGGSGCIGSCLLGALYIALFLSLGVEQSITASYLTQFRCHICTYHYGRTNMNEMRWVGITSAMLDASAQG